MRSFDSLLYILTPATMRIIVLIVFIISFTHHSLSQFSDCNTQASLIGIAELREKFKTPEKDARVSAAQHLSMAYRLHCVGGKTDSIIYYLNKSAKIDPGSICSFVWTWETDSTMYKLKGKKPLFVIDNYDKYRFDYKTLCSRVERENIPTPEQKVSQASEKYQLIYNNDQIIREDYDDLSESQKDLRNQIMKKIDRNHQDIIYDDINNNWTELNEGDIYIAGLVILHADNTFMKKASSIINHLIEQGKLYFEKPIIDRFCCREINYSYNGQYCPKNEEKSRALIAEYFPDFLTK